MKNKLALIYARNVEVDYISGNASLVVDLAKYCFQEMDVKRIDFFNRVLLVLDQEYL